MLDREGFRPNVGIILLNNRNQVFWGKRLNTHSWQFPQGGIDYGETPEQCMFRELEEEVGLIPDHVRIVARTRGWLRYEVPDHFIRRENRGHYRGQKQIWFLLRLMGRDNDINLRASNHPEFDAWRWHDYWVPLENVIEFKREVYQLALTELARYLPRPENRNRYLRGMRRQGDEEQHNHAAFHGNSHGNSHGNLHGSLHGHQQGSDPQDHGHTEAQPTVPSPLEPDVGAAPIPLSPGLGLGVSLSTGVPRADESLAKG